MTAGATRARGPSADGCAHDDEAAGRLKECAAAVDPLALAFELLERMESRRQELAADLVRMHEQERQRIASYVHDEPIQAMAVVGLRLQILREQLTDPAHVEAAASIEQLAADAVARLRNLIFELDPADLESVSLAQALRAYMGQYFRGSGVAFSVRGRFPAEPADEARRTMYRIVHEAVVNARKHAAASQVTVTLSGGRGGWVVTVEDDGRGFDVRAAACTAAPGHLGLRLMTDRARLARGSVAIESTPGRGTRVAVQLPRAPGGVRLSGAPQPRS